MRPGLDVTEILSGFRAFELESLAISIGWAETGTAAACTETVRTVQCHGENRWE